jgi:hypothetical protein
LCFLCDFFLRLCFSVLLLLFLASNFLPPSRFFSSVIVMVSFPFFYGVPVFLCEVLLCSVPT